MRIDEFKLERTLARYQNEVEYDLSASGIYPMFIREVLSPEEMDYVYNDLHLRYVHTAGTLGMRKAVTSFYEKMSPDNVFITNGSSEALYLMAWSLIEPGDEVAFMMPNFMLIRHVVESNRAVVRPFWLKSNDNWSLDAASLNEAVTDKTKLICVCNPNNPTGTVLSASDMEEIVKAASRAGAYILSDEVYRGAEQDGKTTRSFWGMYDKTIIVSGLSKAFGLPGLRLGWISGPSEIIEKSWFYHDFLSTTLTTFSDYMAAKAMEPAMREKIFARNRSIIRENLEMFTSWIDGYKGALSFTPPQAGCFAFVRYNFDVPSWDLVMDMVRNESVFVIPGSCFDIENHLRMNFGVEKGYLKEGLKRMDNVLQKHI